MPIEDLCDEVLVKIFSSLPEFIVHQLLKSKTCAKVAYSLVYKNVVLGSEIEHRCSIIQSNYTGTKALKHQDFMNIMDSVSEWMQSFENAQDFSEFYSSCPYYVPHSLWYHSMSDLEQLDQLRPGLLDRFKCFYDLRPQKQHLGPSYTIPGFFSFCHKRFNANDLDDIPEHVEDLAIDRYSPSRPLLPVESLTISDPTDHFHCETFPNLRILEVKIVPDGIYLNFPRLQKIVLSGGRHVDMSSLKNLQTASLTVKRSTVGLSSDCDFVLPPQLKSIELLEVRTYTPLLQLHQFQFLTSISAHLELDDDAESSYFKPPSGLKVFEIIEDSEHLQSASVLGEDDDYSGSWLTFYNFGDYLDTLVARAWLTKRPFNLPIVRELHLNNQRSPISSFSPNLEYLDFVDYRNVNVFGRIKRLKWLKQEFINPKGIRRVDVPSSMKELTWKYAKISKVTGGENLTKLVLENCDVSLESFNFKHLRILKLKKVKHFYSALLPSSLQSLSIIETHIEGKLGCPKNLRYLEIDHCSDGKEIAVCKCPFLEVLKMIRMKCHLSKLLNISKTLETIYLEKCNVIMSNVDLTSKHLPHLAIINYTQ